MLTKINLYAGKEWNIFGVNETANIWISYNSDINNQQGQMIKIRPNGANQATEPPTTWIMS